MANEIILGHIYKINCKIRYAAKHGYEKTNYNMKNSKLVDTILAYLRVNGFTISTKIDPSNLVQIQISW